LRLRLCQAEPLLEKPISIFRVPYGFVHQHSAADHPDVFRLGDQAAVIPSFTGDGMSIALHSAAMAVKAYQANERARSYHERLRRDVSWQIARAGILYRIGRRHYGQRALLALAQVWPGALRLAAASTRIPARALEREYA
jgi:flavin-dependent dehydrogenase